MIRLIIVILIVIFHKEIYNFLISKNLTSIEGITENFRKKNKQLKNFIQQDNLKEVLQIIKKIDKKLYYDCRIILKNIGKIRNSMIKNVKNNKGYKNDYYNIKFERKRILNILSSIVVNYGFIENHQKIITIVDNYIKKILNEMLYLIKNKEKTIEWFEDYELTEEDTFGVEPNDTNRIYNYDIY